MTHDQGENRQGWKAAGYFLIGMGVPILGAFVFPITSRRGNAPIDLASLSPDQLAVFIVGGGIGLVLTIIGAVILKSR